MFLAQNDETTFRFLTKKNDKKFDEKIEKIFLAQDCLKLLDNRKKLNEIEEKIGKIIFWFSLSETINYPTF